MKISTFPKMIGKAFGGVLIAIAALLCLGALSMQQLPKLERIKYV